MSLYTGNYGDYNSSGNVLYGGYNAEKVATSSDFALALNSYAAAKMWSDKEKTEAIAAARKLVTLPGLRRRRYASTSKDERKLLTAQIRGLTADISPINRKHGMQLLREATGARLRPRLTSAAKQRYSQEFYDYPMNDYRNWMSPTQFAQSIDGLYTPNPRPPVRPSQKRIDRSILQRLAFAATKEYARSNTWAKPYTLPLAAAAMKILPLRGVEREAMFTNYGNLYSYMGKDVINALNYIVSKTAAAGAAAVASKTAAGPATAASSTNTAQPAMGDTAQTAIDVG